MAKERSPLLYLVLGAAGAGALYWAYQAWRLKKPASPTALAVYRGSAVPSLASSATAAWPASGASATPKASIGTSSPQPVSPAPAPVPVSPQPIAQPLEPQDPLLEPPQDPGGDWADGEPVPVDPRQLQEGGRVFQDIGRVIGMIPGVGVIGGLLNVIGGALTSIGNIAERVQPDLPAPQPITVGEDNSSMPGYSDWLATEKGYAASTSDAPSVGYDNWSTPGYNDWLAAEKGYTEGYATGLDNGENSYSWDAGSINPDVGYSDTGSGGTWDTGLAGDYYANGDYWMV